MIDIKFSQDRGEDRLYRTPVRIAMSLDNRPLDLGYFLNVRLSLYSTFTNPNRQTSVVKTTFMYKIKNLDAQTLYKKLHRCHYFI